MIYELVYTSVPRGLKPGSKGYCTVLTTEAIPSSLQERLESLCGYRHLFDPGSPRNPVNYMHHKIQIAGNTWHVLSRIADAGSDYSQRSNLIAHHVAISQDEIKDMACGPATLMLHTGFFRNTWQEEPRRAKESETRSRFARLQGKARLASEWKKLTGDAGFAGEWVNASEESGTQPLHLVYGLGSDVLQIIDEALSLLPTYLQWQITFNSFFTKSIEDCKWRFYCDAATESKGFAGSRFDLKQLRESGEVPDESNPFVQLARTGKSTPQDKRLDKSETDESQKPSTFVKKSQVKSKEPQSGIDIIQHAKRDLRTQGKYQDPAFKRTSPPVLESELPPVLPKPKSAPVLKKKVREPEKSNQKLFLILGTVVLLMVVFVTGMMLWSKKNSNSHTDQSLAEKSIAKVEANTKPTLADTANDSESKKPPAPNTKSDQKNVEEDKTKPLVANVKSTNGDALSNKQEDSTSKAGKKTPIEESPKKGVNKGSAPKPITIENEIKLIKYSDELFVVNLAKEFNQRKKDVRINLSENKIQLPDVVKPIYLDKKPKVLLNIKKEKLSDGQTDVLMIQIPDKWESNLEDSSISSRTNFCVSGTIDNKSVTIAMYEPIKIILQKSSNNPDSLSKYQLDNLSEKDKKILGTIKLFSKFNANFDFENTQFVSLNNNNIFITETNSFNDFWRSVQDRLKIINRADSKSRYIINEEKLISQFFYDNFKSPVAIFCIGLTREKNIDLKRVEKDNEIYDRFKYEAFLFAPALNIDPINSIVSTLRPNKPYQIESNKFNPALTNDVKDSITFYEGRINDLLTSVQTGNLNSHKPILKTIRDLNPKSNIKIDDLKEIKAQPPQPAQPVQTGTPLPKSNTIDKSDPKNQAPPKTDEDLNKEFLNSQEGIKIINLLNEYYSFRIEELKTNLDLIMNQKQGFIINVIGKNDGIRLPIAIYKPDQVSSDKQSQSQK